LLKLGAQVQGRLRDAHTQTPSQEAAAKSKAHAQTLADELKEAKSELRIMSEKYRKFRSRNPQHALTIAFKKAQE
jgi:hypothetical protein